IISSFIEGKEIISIKLIGNIKGEDEASFLENICLPQV
ncbi:unnamed protein product, partial [marine sediment metagenome]